VDLEYESEDEGEADGPLVRNSVLFDARREGEREQAFTDMPRAAQAVRDRDAEDVWAELG
jgi:hypothetical protein